MHFYPLKQGVGEILFHTLTVSLGGIGKKWVQKVANQMTFLVMNRLDENGTPS